MNRVFVSYSRRNESFAERIARDLADAGLDVWFDRRQIQGGENWRDEIFRGLERADFLVVCLSPPAVASEWVAREVKTVRDQDKPIFPIMVQDAFTEMQASEDFSWLLDYQFINFEGRYEEAFPQLLEALPGGRRIGTFDILDPENLPNPFKGLEAFQQRDAQFFFGREELVNKAIAKLKQVNFLAVVGASGSGKSSLIRAGVIPKIRSGALPGSEKYPIIIFTPGAQPVDALATRLHPLLQSGDKDYSEKQIALDLAQPEAIIRLTDELLADFPDDARLLMVIDQFEEAFTRAADIDREPFLNLLHTAALEPASRVEIIITMRSDFFGHLSRYPEIATLFEGQHLLIVTEMTPANLLRAIEGPAQAVQLEFETGLADRILNDVQSQPGSLPLLQYALRELFKRRDGLKLTNAAYDEIGGVQQALAQHAETIYQSLTPERQSIMQQVLLRLIEVGESGEATRRRVAREELNFREIPPEAIDSILDLLTAPEARLLIASREIQAGSADPNQQPTTWIEVSHEALIREWERFKTWVSASAENLRYESEIRKAAADWEASGRDTAYLLRGRRLTRAEIWLDNADATPSQRALIEASIADRREREAAERQQMERELELQQKATRRLRLFIGGLAVFLIVAVILGVSAVNSANQANALAGQLQTTNNQLAQTNSQLERTAAESRSLALSAGAERSFNDGELDAAVALAVQANQLDNPLPQTQRTLADVTFAPGTQRVFTADADLTYSLGAISPDGETLLAVVPESNSIWRWQTSEDAPAAPFITDLNSTIRAVTFNPDGTRVALALAQNSDNLLLLDAATGDILQTLNQHTNEVNAVTFSPDGAYLLSGGADNRVVIWDVASYQPVNAIESYTNSVTALALSGNGQFLASGTTAGDVFLHRLQLPAAAPLPLPTDGRVLFSNDVQSLALNASGTQLIAGDERGSLISIKLDEGELSVIPDLETAITGITFIPDSNLFAVGALDGRLRLWNSDTLRQVQNYDNEAAINHLFLAAGRQIITTANHSLRLWDVVDSAEIQRYTREDNSAFSIALKPDGSQAVSSTSSGSVLIWTTGDGAFFQEFKSHEGLVTHMVYSPDGSLLVSGGIDRQVKVWDAATFQTVHEWDYHGGGILSIAVAADNSVIATSGSDGTIFISDVETGETLANLTGWSNTRSLNFTADGERLLWVGNPPQGGLAAVVGWDWRTSETPAILYNEEPARSVVARPDMTQIAVGLRSGNIVLADFNGVVQREWEAHANRVENIFYVPDGSQIVSGSVDGSIRLWDAATGLELRRYEVENEAGRAVGLRALAMSADGRLVLSGMSDNTVRLWLLLPNIGDLLDHAQANRFVREITCDERRRFGIEPLCE